MKLAIPQIASLAANAGFSGPDLVVAVSVALAESGGDPQAYNPETMAGAAQGRGSFGLWQIYLQAHPEFAGSNLFDPQTNANAAFAVYQRAGGFGPWSTFQHGNYLSFVDVVTQAIAPPTDTVVANDASGASDIPNVFLPDSSGDSSSIGIMIVGSLLVLWAVGKFFNG